jgi:hypothetical protein
MVRILPTILALFTLLACDLQKKPRAAESESSGNSSRAGEPMGGTGSPEDEVDAGEKPIACTQPGGCPDDKPQCSVANVCVECLTDAACAVEAPRCEPSSNACVQCLGDEDCSSDAPLCDLATFACVQCQTTEDCDDASAPRCDAQQCVACTKKSDCDHIRDKPICDLDDKSEMQGACVQCQKHADCTDPENPQCTDHACGPCTENENACEGRRGTTVCNPGPGRGAGTCVQCTSNNEAACADNVCDPKAHTCASERKASAGICQPCIADSQCRTDHRCIELNFRDAALGTFCLKRMSTGCNEPFTINVTRESIAGLAAENYCGINEDDTTCAAIADAIASKECEDADECGAMMGDGLCEQVGGQENRCTYPCGVSAHCPDGLDCGTDQGYCL